MLHPFADDVQLPLESGGSIRRVVGASRDQDLLEHGLDGHGARPERAIVGGHFPPAHDLLPLFDDDPLEEHLDAAPAIGVVREEDQAGAIASGRRQVDRQTSAFLAEEPIRHLEEDAGAVPGVRLTPARAAMLQVDEHLQRLLHDGVRLLALDVRDEPDAARVVLV